MFDTGLQPDCSIASPSHPRTRPSLLSFLPDHHLPYIVPAIVYWVISFIFHYIDTRGLLSAYKLHTPAEDLTKNRASRKDVIKFALLQQAAQCLLGYIMADDSEQFVPHEYAIAEWAKSLRYIGTRATGWIQYFAFQSTWTANEFKSHPAAPLAAVLQDPYIAHSCNSSQGAVPGSVMPTMPFSAWDIIIAKTVYWVVVPLLQYVCAMVLADTFQYFTHRAFHVNKWLYKHIHSMHHDVYVPFAYGAFYNHPLETIPVDAIGFPLCLSLVRLDNRQAAVFGAIWTFKTVVDHCGYDFPYNPCNIVCPHSVLFHDLHHQQWGMKYNFSVYGSFWDWLMGTYWSPHDEKAQEKYRRGKATAEAKNAAAARAAAVAKDVVAIGTSNSVEFSKKLN